MPDRPIISRRSMTTRLRMPTGQWVLVGTLQASSDGEAAEGTLLHLLIRVDAGTQG
jgi:type II secretory pathway component GspD/PulD (secretin)